MSKGFANYAAAIIFMLIVFVLVNYIISQSLNREISISDYTSQLYKMINSAEAVRVHSTQLLKISVGAAKQDLTINDINLIKNDGNLKNQFLDKVKSYFHPSLSYSNADISINVISVDIEGTKIVSKIEVQIESLNPELSGSKIYGTMTIFSEFSEAKSVEM